VGGFISTTMIFSRHACKNHRILNLPKKNTGKTGEEALFTAKNV
jgi:hypothetical protein